MISFGSPTLGSVKVSPSRVASPENYKHQTLKVSGVTPKLPNTVKNILTKVLNLSGGLGPSNTKTGLIR